VGISVLNATLKTQHHSGELGRVDSSAATKDNFTKCVNANENQVHHKQEKKENNCDSRFEVKPLTMLCKQVKCLLEDDISQNDNAQNSSNTNTMKYVESLSTLCSKVIDSNDTVSTTREGPTWTNYQHDLPKQFIKILGEAVRKRVVNLPQRQCITYDDVSEVKTARVGVLFSGGIDSIVLAALADR